MLGVSIIHKGKFYVLFCNQPHFLATWIFKRYSQLSDWKSGTNCSSSGTWAAHGEGKLFILTGLQTCFRVSNMNINNLYVYTCHIVLSNLNGAPEINHWDDALTTKLCFNSSYEMYSRAVDVPSAIQISCSWLRSWKRSVEHKDWFVNKQADLFGPGLNDVF